MSRWSDFLITVIGGGCAQALKALKDNTSELANNVARGILGACGILAFWGALTKGSINKPALPPTQNSPGQHAPAAAPKQGPKKGAKGLEQPPNEPAKPGGRGQQGFIVIGSGTTLYFDRSKKPKNLLKDEEIKKQQRDIIDVEYEQYCEDFNLI